jgi:hypothetical protein
MADEIETKSFELNINEFDVILKSIRHLNSEEKLGSTDGVTRWNETKIALEKQGLECGWLQRSEPSNEDQSGGKGEPIEAEVVEK